MHNWHHVANNFYFRRRKDNGVEMVKHNVKGFPPVNAVPDLVFTDSTWASLIAHVSARKEDYENTALFRRFHNGASL